MRQAVFLFDSVSSIGRAAIDELASSILSWEFESPAEYLFNVFVRKDEENGHS